jgi:hypothetical protein
MGLIMCNISAMYLILSFVGSKSMSLVEYVVTFLGVELIDVCASLGSIQSLSSTFVGAFY